MTFVLSQEAQDDVWSIWQRLVIETGLSVANRVEATIFDKIKFIAKRPGLGHWRRDLTSEPVKFFAVTLT